MQVFCVTGDAAHEEMRSACFEYLRLGGMYSAGPISLLSGLNPRPSVLVTHFFMVAVFGFSRRVPPPTSVHVLLYLIPHNFVFEENGVPFYQTLAY